MLVRPQIDENGDNYTIPPEVKVIGGSMFANYLSNEIATIAEFNQTSDSLMVNDDSLFEVNRPYAKALLQDTNVTSVRVRPQELNELGIYNAHGGFGHHRDNPPTVTIHRASFWEDYNDPNATAKAYVDGVGTISPRNSANNTFLGNRWERRAASDPIPDLVVWGTGAEANATITQTTSTTNPVRYYHNITIHNQGFGFEPNATMAVLHYPLNPMALWTFDKHESLYDSDNTRFYPSPGWNSDLANGPDHYWSFDEENGTTVADGAGSNNITVPELSENNRSVWGAKGRALALMVDDPITPITLNGVPASKFTVSMWLKPNAGAAGPSTFTIGGGGPTLTISADATQFTFDSLAPINRHSTTSRWAHIAVVSESSNNGTFYVDGKREAATPSFNPGTITSTNFDGSIDEVRIFDRILEESEIKYLAGRAFLDISGNKFHAVPVGENLGTDFEMNDPATEAGSSTDHPTVELNNNTNGLPRALGDSDAMKITAGQSCLIQIKV